LAQLAHHPRALGAQTLVAAVAAKGGDDFVSGRDQLADKPTAGERAGTSEQNMHRRRSAPDQPPGAGPPCGGLTRAHIADVCDSINCGMVFHEKLTSGIPTRRGIRRVSSRAPNSPAIPLPIPLPASSAKLYPSG